MNVKFYLQHANKDNRCFRTERVEHKTEPMRHHKLGLSYTKTGYGAKIPTQYMVKYNNRWHRVYCAVYGNTGSAYIVSSGDKIRVTEYNI